MGVLENTVLRRIFGPKRDKVIVKWRKLHNEELTNLYFWSNIIRFIKSRRMRWSDMQHVWSKELCIRGFGGEN